MNKETKKELWQLYIQCTQLFFATIGLLFVLTWMWRHL